MILRRATLTIIAALLVLTACSADQATNAGTEIINDTSSNSPNESDIVKPAIPSESAAPTSNNFRDMLSADKITTADLCKNYETAILNFQRRASKRLNSAEGKYKDAWAAASYRSSHPWVKENLTTIFTDQISETAVGTLNELTNGQAGLIDDLKDYVTASIAACGMEKKFAATKSAVAKSVSLGSTIRTKANSKPWYPRGYSKFGEVAWKWTDESCGNNYGYCWTARVVSELGCFDGVYAEVNISQGGTIVGWSNDTVGSLPPGKVAKLQFTEYGGSGTKSATITELNCR
jgi:hypothetical protein